jgi:uncharacterized membrane protein HdeD (DUF308 family)
MQQEMTADPADALVAIARSWGWVFAFGMITLLVGILTVAWPGRTVLVVAVLFGIQLFVAGIFRLVMAFTDEGEGHRVAYALIGIFSILVGILCLRHLFQNVAALASILDRLGHRRRHGLLRRGLHQGMRRGWTIFMGVLVSSPGSSC